MKRQRNRNNNNNRRTNNNRSSESNGPDNMKIRGNISTIHEKYMSLARDAQSSGDRVKAENFLQHAEHYHRLISAAQAATEARNAERAEQQERRERADNRKKSDEDSEKKPRRSSRSKSSEGSESGSSESETKSDPTEVITPEGSAEGTDLKADKPAPKKRAPRRKKTDVAPAEEAAG